MNNWKDLTTAVQNHFRALSFMRQHSLSKFFIYPLLLNILFYLLGFLTLNNLTDDFVLWLESWIHFDEWTFVGGEVVASIAQFLLYAIIKLMALILLMIIGGHIVLALMSPILSYLSEKTDQIINGTDYSFDLKQTISDTLRGIMLSLKNFLFELGFIVLFFILSFAPLIGFISAPCLFLISAYYYGFSFIDYNLERAKFNSDSSSSFMKNNKGFAIGSGLPFALTLLIPFLGIFLASFVSIISTVAAAITFQQKSNIKQNI